MTARLYFLGVPHFERDGKPADLTVSKAVALLAYLAATGRAQPRDRLLGLLWGESTEEAARKNLRNTLWTIRRALGDDLITSAEDRLALDASAWSDTRAFTVATTVTPDSGMLPEERVRSLQSASALYTGPFLDGVTLSEAPEFELWATTERERLGQMHLRVLSTLGELYRESEDWPRAIEVAEQALQEDNLQEPMYRLLMEAHARLGQRAEAMHAYDRLRATLERELGVEPLPETEAVRNMALATVPALPQKVGSVQRAGARIQPAPPFVGRHSEFEALDEALAAAAGGQVCVLLITGELGIGKSTLWREWSGQLPPDTSRTILEARCVEATHALPFAPVAQLFRDEPCLQRLLGPASPVPRIWLAEVARLMPEIRAARPDLPLPPPLSPGEERTRIFEAFAQYLLAFGARPLVFFIDDVHWADSATLAWLGYLAERLRGQPLLLVAAYRPDEASPELVRLTAGWARQGLARRVPLERLTPEESAYLIRALHVPALRAHQVHAQGAGNPFFLVELSRAATSAEAEDSGVPPESLPPVLTELVQARLERLNGPARQVLQAAAVLEPSFDFATLRRASGRGEEETLDALDELLEAALVVESTVQGQGPEDAGNSHEYSISHPLVADIVRDGLSGARRAFLYRRAAEALEATYAGRLPEVAGRLATDFAQAGEKERAARYAQMAAEHALALAAPAEAAAFYRQALALEPRPDRHLGLGRALSGLGALPDAREEFQAALAAFVEASSGLGAAQACLAMAMSYLPAGRGDEVLRWAQQGLAYLDTHAHPDVDPRTHAESHLLLGAGFMRSGQALDRAEAEVTEAARLADEKGLLDMAARSRFELGTLLAHRGDLAAAIASYHAAIELARKGNDRAQEILSLNNAAYHEQLAGDLTAAHADIAAALALDEEFDLVPPRQYIYSTRGEIALADHEWDVAESWFNRALAEARRQGNNEQAAGTLANLGLAARGRGDLDEALTLLESAREAAAALPTPYLQAQIDLWLAELSEERGERAAALAALKRAEAKLSGSGYGRLEAWADRVRARLGGRRG